MPTTHAIKPDWDPRSPEVTRDQRAAYDEMRERCPVAYSELMQWSIFRYEDVLRILLDPETFSNAVSRHVSVPNGMDPPQHTAYRRMIEPYFSPERMRVFEGSLKEIVTDLLTRVLAKEEVDFVKDFALPFAVQAQCAFLGWPDELHEPLIRWTHDNHKATYSQDRPAMEEIAKRFKDIIDSMLAIRREAKPEDDITASLMHEEVGGRRLNGKEIASILRNWTVGEIGTITASIGILVHYLADHPDLQKQLREQPELLPPAIDEILRIHGPLVASRRVTTKDVEIAGRKIPKGARLSLNWVSANRDGRVFEDPDTFSLDRDPDKNLLYGAGIHVCPGAPMARLEMRVVMEELLGRTTEIAFVPGRESTNAVYPASGYAVVPVSLR